MFRKKYVFETRATRLKRRFQSVLGFVCLGLFCYLLCGLFVIYVSMSENEKTHQSLFQRNPDLVVIFTGDKGRITIGLEKALEFQCQNILITGVYTSNSVKTILRGQNSDLLRRINSISNLIELDYMARNTVENVFYTLEYLNKNHHLNKVLIISSDYHILRIKIILSMLSNKQHNQNFYFWGIANNYSNYRNLKILFKEIYKTFKASLFLAIWDVDDFPDHLYTDNI